MPRCGDRGATLTEMLVALAIAAGVMAGLVVFVQKIRQSSAQNAGQIAAQQEAAEIIALLQKDLTFVNTASATPVQVAAPASPAMYITTINADTSASVLTYQSACRKAPARLTSAHFAAAAPNGCLPNGACPDGQLPTLTVTRPLGQANQVYPRLVAAGASGSDHTAIGTMGCFTVSGPTLTVELTNFYLDQTGIAKAIKKSTALPLSSATKLQILR